MLRAFTLSLTDSLSFVLSVSALSLSPLAFQCLLCRENVAYFSIGIEIVCSVWSGHRFPSAAKTINKNSLLLCCFFSILSVIVSSSIKYCVSWILSISAFFGSNEKKTQTVTEEKYGLKCKVLREKEALQRNSRNCVWKTRFWRRNDESKILEIYECKHKTRIKRRIRQEKKKKRKSAKNIRMQVNRNEQEKKQAKQKKIFGFFWRTFFWSSQQKLHGLFVLASHTHEKTLT